MLNADIVVRGLRDEILGSFLLWRLLMQSCDFRQGLPTAGQSTLLMRIVQEGFWSGKHNVLVDSFKLLKLLKIN
jgi:hypothetical protein